MGNTQGKEEEEVDETEDMKRRDWEKELKKRNGGVWLPLLVVNKNDPQPLAEHVSWNELEMTCSTERPFKLKSGGWLDAKLTVAAGSGL